MIRVSKRSIPAPLPAAVAGLLIAAAAHAGGAGRGLVATSSDDNAVRGEAGNVSGATPPPDPSQIGIVGLGANRGIYGASATGAGIYGVSDGNYGVWGQSAAFRGVTGRTNRADNNYGLYTPDNLFSLNVNLMEAVLQVAENGGAQPLEPGDVVVFSGVRRPEELRARAAAADADPATRAAANLGAPLVQVASAGQSASRAVAGVVFGRFRLEAVDPDADLPAGDAETTVAEDGPGLAGLEVTPAGAATPGEYVLVVVQGPAEVRVDPLSAEIRPGDALQSGELPATAARAEEIWVDGASVLRPSTVIGTALEPSGSGRERIYVYVGGSR